MDDDRPLLSLVEAEKRRLAQAQTPEIESTLMALAEKGGGSLRKRGKRYALTDRNGNTVVGLYLADVQRVLDAGDT